MPSVESWVGIDDHRLAGRQRGGLRHVYRPAAADGDHGVVVAFEARRDAPHLGTRVVGDGLAVAVDTGQVGADGRALRRAADKQRRLHLERVEHLAQIGVERVVALDGAQEARQVDLPAGGHRGDQVVELAHADGPPAAAPSAASIAGAISFSARARSSWSSISTHFRPADAFDANAAAAAELFERVLVVDLHVAGRDELFEDLRQQRTVGRVYARQADVLADRRVERQRLVQAVEHTVVAQGDLHRLLVDGQQVVDQQRRALGRGQPARQLGLEQQVAVDDHAAAGHDLARLPQRDDVVLVLPAIVEEGLDAVVLELPGGVPGDRDDAIEAGGTQVFEGAVGERAAAGLDQRLRRSAVRSVSRDPRPAAR